MSTERPDLRTEVILSVQRALLGEVTPDIRAVAVGWEGGVVRARFVFDHPVTEDDRDKVLGINMYVQDDFDDFQETDFTAEFSLERPLELKPGEGWWVYMRDESWSPDGRREYER